MSSSNHHQQHRSSSSRSGRRPENDRQVQTNRSRSVPQRQVIIILTNNPDVLENSEDLQPQNQGHVERGTVQGNDVNHNHQMTQDHDARREALLQNLLGVEIRQAFRAYITRSHRPFPIHYVFRLLDRDF